MHLSPEEPNSILFQLTATGACKRLLVDEVSLGLSPQAVEIVYGCLRALIRDGATVVLVEQDLARALSVAGRVVCLLEGRVVLRSATSGVTREQVTEAYFGLSRSGGAA